MTNQNAPSRTNLIVFGLVTAAALLGALATADSVLLWINLIVLAFGLIGLALAWCKPSVFNRKR